MRPTNIILCILLLVAVTQSLGQGRFRSGIFLHHSTGGCIWGPNGGEVSVRGEIARYNYTHGLSGPDSMNLAEKWWPSDDNDWWVWHAIFDNNGGADDIRPFLDAYPIVMIKSCFPSSSMTGLGSSADSLSPRIKSVANYKWHWRSLVSLMKQRPQNFFVIWTNAPLVAGETNSSQATLSNAFCRWAKDTLAAGLDQSFGPFPKNVFVFDFFHSLADSSGMLPSEYAAGPADSHPNAKATTLVAPVLVKQVFDAALAYETTTGAADHGGLLPTDFRLEQNYPNPFNPKTVVSSQLPVASHVRMKIYDVSGKEVATLVDAKRAAGSYQDVFDGNGLTSGVYICQLVAGSFVQARKMLLLK
jgi:hypothetical protein